jgi:signal transduction histidine kinase
MIRWIQQKNWLPEILLSAFVFLVLGGLDLISQGPIAMLGSLAIASSLMFVRRFSFLTSVLVLTASVIQVSFTLLPIFGSIGIPLVAFIVGAFSSKPWREVNYVVAVLGGLGFAANLSFNPALNIAVYGGFVELQTSGRVIVFVTLVLLSVSLVTLMWILGRLLITRLVHVGRELDRLVYEDRQLKLSIELAEQSKRFEIARDINENAVQKLASVITNAEGGIYVAKTNPEAGIRALDKILVSARAAHSELRRLFDMINRGTVVSTTLPTLRDLNSLAITMREKGLDVEVSYFGTEFDLDQAAELAIYRIVYGALENVKQHNPQGTKAKVELIWLDAGLQVMIKDNGVEVQRRARLGPNGLPMPYDADQDLDTLLEKVSGPGLTAMREQAESFGGSLEVQRVVGVGFTVSAMFPGARVKTDAGPLS